MYMKRISTKNDGRNNANVEKHIMKIILIIHNPYKEWNNDLLILVKTNT